MNPRRHAYCIMVHDQPDRVVELCRLLQHPRNSLYVIVDRRRSLEQFAGPIRRAGLDVKVLPSEGVPRWGSFGQVRTMLGAWQAACADGPFDYLHLLSGADMPLKTQDYIHRFCDSLPPATQLIDICNDPEDQADACRKATARFFLQNALQLTPIPLVNRVLHHSLNMFPAWIQRNVGLSVNRDIPIIKSPTWSSLTYDCVQYILERKDWIRRHFKSALCPDELFVASALNGSPFSLYPGGSMRLIDWTRGDPYVWRTSDFDQLCASDALFARKFEPQIDSEIIQLLRRLIGSDMG